MKPVTVFSDPRKPMIMKTVPVVHEQEIKAGRVLQDGRRAA